MNNNPGNAAINNRHWTGFLSGARILPLDATKRREKRGVFGNGNGGPAATDLRRRGTVHTAFDAGVMSRRAVSPRIPASRTQQTA